jgi:hypothetical protein
MQSTSIADILSQAGVFGYLLVAMATVSIPVGILLAVLRKDAAAWLLALTVPIAAGLGLAGRTVGVAMANRTLEASEGRALVTELAGVYAVADSPLLMGLVLSATLLGLLLIVLLTLKKRLPEVLLCCAALVFCVGAAARTGRLMKANSLIASSQDSPVVDVVDGKLLVGSSDHFASTTGPWREDFDRAAGLLRIAQWGGLGLAVAGAGAFVSRRRRRERPAE